MLNKAQLIPLAVSTCLLPLFSLHSSGEWIRLNSTRPAHESNPAATQPVEASLPADPHQQHRKVQEQVSNKKPKGPTHYPGFVEAKIAYFRPTSGDIRQIYDRGIPMVGIEGSARACPYLYPWASVGYLQQIGHTPIYHTRTQVQLAPIGFGLKFLYDFKPLSVYAGAGALISYLRMKDDSPYVIPSSSKWSWGGIGKVGLLFFPIKHFSVDLFADYSYMKFDFHKGERKVIRRDVDFSGWSFGGALGFAF